MKRTTIAVLSTLALLSIPSLAGAAPAISDQDLIEAASNINVESADNLAGVDSGLTAALAAGPANSPETVGEAPEGTEAPEGADPDGPGGSTHESTGEETGDH